MKPLEPGCKAIIINLNDEYNGVEVTCLEYLPIGTKIPVLSTSFSHAVVNQNAGWKIDKTIAISEGYFGVVKMQALPENHLMRIDGYEEEENIIQEKEIDKPVLTPV